MKYDAWSNVGDTPAEVQAYIDKLNKAEDTKILFIDSLVHGTPDGECHSESWMVVSEYKIGGITIKNFWYDHNTEGNELRYTSDSIHAASDILKIAKLLLNDEGHRIFWEYLNKTEEVA